MNTGMDIEEVLKLLADGRFHSGEELGDCLGVSRTAVWKQLKKLEPLGLPLHSVKGKGYCLEGGLELLRPETIVSGLNDNARALLLELDVQTIVDSTNVRAAERVARGNAHGYVCSAEQQTAGKGRRGRPWVSPFGKNIYLSAVWGFDGGIAVLEGLSLAVGVAVVRGLQAAGLEGLRLKWPNDVLWNGRKLAGILLEMTGDVDGYCQVVVGLGVNVTMPPASGATIDQQWVDVQSIIGDCSRNQLMIHILNHLLPMFKEFQAGGFSALRPEWEQLDAYRNCVVELLTPKAAHCGVALGVNDSGAIRVRVDGHERVFSGGEISLRAAP